MRDCLNITLAQKWQHAILQISANKSLCYAKWYKVNEDEVDEVNEDEYSEHNPPLFKKKTLH
mgnify:CR=1 FL=1